MSDTIKPKELVEELWNVIKQVKENQMTPEKGLCIAGSARAITRIAKLQLEVLQANKEKPTKDLLDFAKPR